MLKLCFLYLALCVLSFEVLFCQGQPPTCSSIELPKLPPPRNKEQREMIEDIESFESEYQKTKQEKDMNNPDSLNLLAKLGATYFELSMHQNDPTRRHLLERASQLFREGVEISYRNIDDSVEVQFLDLLAKAQVFLQQDCVTAETLKRLALLQSDDDSSRSEFEKLRKDVFSTLSRSSAGEFGKDILKKFWGMDDNTVSNIQLSKLSEEVRILLVTYVSHCYPKEGIVLWDKMLEGGYLTVNDAEKCRSCWAFMITAHWRVAGKEAAQAMFDKLQLSKHTPWKHVTQVSEIFNAALTTTEPQPWLEPKDYHPCQILEENKHDIIEEFAFYNRSIVTEENDESIPVLKELYHFDSSLAPAGKWTYLHLQRMFEIDGVDGKVGWVESHCNTFPKTCAAIKKLPEVSHELKTNINGKNGCRFHDNDGYSAWCRDEEKSLPGSVAFYTLSPGASVRLHNGPSNQRLKCQLVVSAPEIASNSTEDGNNAAWIEVAGERKSGIMGQVHAFDESYIHEVRNDGDVELVVLDVSFWHPDVLSQEKSDSQGEGLDTPAEESAATQGEALDTVAEEESVATH